jgi:Mg2+ and Co2+ transporter CorA
VAAELLSPGGVERQCAACHGSDDPVAQRPQRARVALEQIYEARRDLTAARRASGGMQDAVTRLALEQLFQLAESSVVQGADSLHRFVFVEAEQHLREAHAHIDRLLARLVNPE